MISFTTIKPIALATACILALASCSTSESPEAVACPACQVTERIDLHLEGDLNQAINLELPEDAPDKDLVRLYAQGNPATGFDMVLDLGDDWKMTIRVQDSENLNPWLQVNMPYHIYPTADLEDKRRYVSAEIRRGDDNAAYSTHLGHTLPQGFSLDAFRITDNDGLAIRARIRDLVLYKNTDAQSTVTVNGTLTGAVIF